MPNFHIELRSETHVRETMVVEKDDLTAARIEVAKFVGALLNARAEVIWEDQDWRVDCTDDEGLILFTMSVFASDAAATIPYRHKV